MRNFCVRINSPEFRVRNHDLMHFVYKLTYSSSFTKMCEIVTRYRMLRQTVADQHGYRLYFVRQYEMCGCRRIGGNDILVSLHKNGKYA